MIFRLRFAHMYERVPYARGLIKMAGGAQPRACCAGTASGATRLPRSAEMPSHARNASLQILMRLLCTICCLFRAQRSSMLAAMAPHARPCESAGGMSRAYYHRDIHARRGMRAYREPAR